MKNWKIILLVAGILLIAASFVVYGQHISTCYYAGQDLPQFTLESRMQLAGSLQPGCPADGAIWEFPGVVPARYAAVFGILVNEPPGSST